MYARDHLSEMVALDKLRLPEQIREDRKRSCVNTRKRLRGCSTIPYSTIQYYTIPFKYPTVPYHTSKRSQYNDVPLIPLQHLSRY